MTFYKYRYNEIVADHGWQSLLIAGNSNRRRLTSYSFHRRLKHKNNSKANLQTLQLSLQHKHWILEYRHILGNRTFMAILLGLILFILPTTTVTFMLLYAKYALNKTVNPGKVDFSKNTVVTQIYSGVLWINLIGGTLFAIFFIYLVIFQINKFTDLLYIRHEIVNTAYALVGLVIFALIWVFVGSEASIEISWIAYGLAFSIIFSFISYSMITNVIIQYNKTQSQRQSLLQSKHQFKPIKLFPLKFNLFPTLSINSDPGHDTTDINIDNDQKHVPLPDDKTVLTNVQSASKSTHKNSHTNTHTHFHSHSRTQSARFRTNAEYFDGLNKLLSHESGFSLFMRHLVCEWSVENLLFITEISQFKKSTIFGDVHLQAKYNKSSGGCMTGSYKSVETSSMALSFLRLPTFLSLDLTFDDDDNDNDRHSQNSQNSQHSQQRDSQQYSNENVTNVGNTNVGDFLNDRDKHNVNPSKTAIKTNINLKMTRTTTVSAQDTPTIDRDQVNLDINSSPSVEDCNSKMIVKIQQIKVDFDSDNGDDINGDDNLNVNTNGKDNRNENLSGLGMNIPLEKVISVSITPEATPSLEHVQIDSDDGDEQLQLQVGDLQEQFENNANSNVSINTSVSGNHDHDHDQGHENDANHGNSNHGNNSINISMSIVTPSIAPQNSLTVTKPKTVKPVRIPELAVTNIPKSKIMKEKNIFKKISMIMECYIDDNAPLQINLSSKQNELLQKKITRVDQIKDELKDKEININDLEEDSVRFLYKVFDEPTKQMLKFVLRSFIAFSETEVCLAFSFYILFCFVLFCFVVLINALKFLNIRTQVYQKFVENL